MMTARPLIAKIHVAKTSLGLDDDAYRAMLVRTTGKASCSQMTFGQLEKCLDELKRLGFKDKRPKAAPHVAKAYVLWGELYRIGAVREKYGLTGYVKRMTGIDRPEWMSAGQANVVIEGLKAWIARADK